MAAKWFGGGVGESTLRSPYVSRGITHKGAISLFRGIFRRSRASQMPRLARCSQIFLSLLVHPHRGEEVCLILASVINARCFFSPIVADFPCQYCVMPWLQRCRTNLATAGYGFFGFDML